MKADSVKDGAITASSIAIGAITSAGIANGSITLNKLDPTLLGSNVWLLGGNTLTRSSFLGSLNNVPIEVRVNNHRAMRYSYAEDTVNPGGEFRGINVLGGSEVNSISAGVTGATISGGGQDKFTETDAPNTVTANFGAIGGGLLNLTNGFASTVAGGNANTANDTHSAVGGGQGNTARGYASTVGGGRGNATLTDYSTVAGGYFNAANALYSLVGGGLSNVASGFASLVASGYSHTASGDYSTVGGGISNTASGYASFVGSGYFNTASGSTSFAGWQRANAAHDGAFVWADHNDVAFASTAPNQFLIRAGGGFGINTNTLRGDFDLRSASGNADLYIQAGGASVGVNFGVVSDGTLFLSHYNGTSYTDRVTLSSSGNVGIGRFPSYLLDVNGTIRVAGTLYASDRRYKKNIEPLENSLDALLNLRGVTYEWKDRNFSAGKQIGLIAQEVEAIFPELVKSDADGYKSVNYVSLVPVTIEAIKAQQKEIEALKTKNSELEARLAAIEKLLLKKK